MLIFVQLSCLVYVDSLHCALASGAVYCNRSCLFVCVCVCNGRAVSEPYYSQRARSVCVSLIVFYFIIHAEHVVHSAWILF